jgi:hypothetical protein
MVKGGKVIFWSRGRKIDGKIDTIVYANNVQIGAIVESYLGSFYILRKVDRLPAGACRQYGSVMFQYIGVR